MNQNPLESSNSPTLVVPQKPEKKRKRRKVKPSAPLFQLKNDSNVLIEPNDMSSRYAHLKRRNTEINQEKFLIIFKDVCSSIYRYKKQGHPLPEFLHALVYDCGFRFAQLAEIFQLLSSEPPTLENLSPLREELLFFLDYNTSEKVGFTFEQTSWLENQGFKWEDLDGGFDMLDHLHPGQDLTKKRQKLYKEIITMTKSIVSQLQPTDIAKRCDLIALVDQMIVSVQDRNHYTIPLNVQKIFASIAFAYHSIFKGLNDLVHAESGDEAKEKFDLLENLMGCSLKSSYILCRRKIKKRKR